MATVPVGAAKCLSGSDCRFQGRVNVKGKPYQATVTVIESSGSGVGYIRSYYAAHEGAAEYTSSQSVQSGRVPGTAA